jgi:hypothetical protein
MVWQIFISAFAGPIDALGRGVSVADENVSDAIREIFEGEVAHYRTLDVGR